MAKGTYFEFEYFVEIHETKDVIKPIQISCATYQKHRSEDQAAFVAVDGYSRWFYDDELMTINGVPMYLSKYDMEYEYCPNKRFNHFYGYSVDTDDFGDDEEGWDAFAEEMEAQSDYDYKIEKVRYTGVILSEDKEVVKTILAELEQAFYLENDCINEPNDKWKSSENPL